MRASRALPLALLLGGALASCLPEFPTLDFPDNPDTDWDGDGYTEHQGDCDDADAESSPDTVWYLDTDLDGYGDDDRATTACTAPGGATGRGGDCDDTSPAVFPGAEERCDLVDDDCDGLVDDEGACGGTEICNGVDDDGNGTVDDGVPGEGMSCGTNVGTCRVGQTMCVGGSIQCTGAIGPASETCPNGADDDCNGLVDDCIGVDAGGPTCDIDGDGYVADTGCGGGALDCDDTRSDVSPAQVELCDSIDNDCDALVDEGACG